MFTVCSDCDVCVCGVRAKDNGESPLHLVCVCVCVCEQCDSQSCVCMYVCVRACVHAHGVL